MTQKKYLILTALITDIGGGQIYTKNKYLYLQENGWDVVVFSAEYGNVIMIDELRNFENNIVYELKHPPYLFSKKTQNIIVNDIVIRSLLDNKDEIIVESQTIATALWGELIAKKLKCKHFIFLLMELYGNMHVSTMDYLNFKHKRKELVGITNKSLELLFKNYKTLEQSEKYFLNAVCSNSVEDVDNPIIDSISKMDINIGCISRLQKPYIDTMIDEIVRFAKRNNKKSIQLVLVGGSPYIKTEQKIINKVKSANNIKLIMTGRLFPIPRKLFKIMDIFIGVSGSAQASASEGVLTMILDVRDHKPIGLLGYDTQNCLYADTKTNASISTILDNVLIKEQLHNNYQKMNINIKITDFRNEFNNHLEFLQTSASDKEYYVIKTKNIGIKNKTKKALVIIMGFKAYEKLLSFMVKIRASFLFCRNLVRTKMEKTNTNKVQKEAVLK